MGPPYKVDSDAVAPALLRYKEARKKRTAKTQINSHGNGWLRKGGNADWVYGYDAWEKAL